MTLEERTLFDTLQVQVTELKKVLDSLKNNATIPFEIGEAMKARVGSLTGLSDKTAASETQAVNEGGAGSYNVAKAPDGFFSSPEGKYIPYYD